ncbi:MAG: ankyrin repeat domain-containing protein [Gemmatimonadota bacterium]|nr:MAG: ankyrin repeat domain-containing protein [Gemmatimonadota bacterium]
MRSAIGVPVVTLFLAFAGLALVGQDAVRRDQDDSEGREFVAAARRGDENAVRKALEADPALVTATDALGMTALDWAATGEHWHIFRQLLAKGAPVNSVGFDGGTVMHRVCHYDRPDMVELLLEAGADIAVQNQWGRTPLHVTARRGSREVAKLLLARGADPDAATREGWTTLHVAYRAGQPELVELLLAAGADPQKRDSAGELPIEHWHERPEAVAIEGSKLYEYQGLYDVSANFRFKVWLEGERLRLQDFGADDMYPTGPDSFYCRSEPWSVAFMRDEDGAVKEIEVHFLRRAVRGTRREHPQYIGSHQCRACHLGEAHGNPYLKWVSSRHAAAYWRLATDWALFLALSRPHFQDMENPRADSRCLLCHATAAQDPDALFASTFDVGEGVGCEACHGPGSEYRDPAIMSDRAAFRAAGGRIPDQGTCRSCHRNPDRFQFEEWWPGIAHGEAAGTESR